MSMIRVLCCLPMLLPAAAWGDDPAPALPKAVRQELDKAQECCRTAAQTARQALLAAIDKAVRKTATDRQLNAEQRVAAKETLVAEKTAFQQSSVAVPTAASLQAAAKEYRTQCQVARQRCEDAYEKVGRALLAKGNAASVKALAGEREELFAGLGLGSLRRVWVGKSTDEGIEYVKKLAVNAAGEWAETVNDLDGPNRFREVVRTAELVELHDAKRNISLRLYDDRAMAKSGAGAWSPFAKGGWESPPVSAPPAGKAGKAKDSSP